MRFNSAVLIFIMFTQFICLGLFYFNFIKPDLVIFDVQKTQGQLISQLAQHRATEGQVKRVSLQFKSVLQKTLQQYSKQNKVIILDSKSILAGGQDVTQGITKDIAEAMGKMS